MHYLAAAERAGGGGRFVCLETNQVSMCQPGLAEQSH